MLIIIRNRDGFIDYAEFQPMINDMCEMITQRYGYGPTVDKIRAAWSSLDFNSSGYITRNEFSTRARYELERILTQPDYIPAGYNPGMYGNQGYVPPAYPQPGLGYQSGYPGSPPVVIPPTGGYGAYPPY